MWDECNRLVKKKKKVYIAFKNFVILVLLGEEMQSSSEDEESDSDIEKVLRRRDDKKDVINSEVIDSTSVLPHALPVTVDVEEDKSVHEEAAGEEAIQGDSEDENDAGMYY